jgi:E3 ubiquitin-protein ligase UBR1
MISTDIRQLISKQEHLTSTGLTACIKNSREVFREEMCDDIISWIYKLLPFTQYVARIKHTL